MANASSDTSLPGIGALRGYLYNNHPRLGRSSRGKRLAVISQENTLVVEELVKEIKKSAKAGRQAEANRLIKIAQMILDNNERLQNIVGEVLADTD